MILANIFRLCVIKSCIYKSDNQTLIIISLKTDPALIMVIVVMRKSWMKEFVQGRPYTPFYKQYLLGLEEPEKVLM